MAIARNGGVSLRELAALDIFDFFILLQQLDDSLKKQSKKAKK